MQRPRKSVPGTILGKLTLKQVLDALEHQILIGKTYWAIANGLLKAEPIVYGTAPTFFGLVVDGSLELAQIVVAKLYDRSEQSVTITAMLFQAARQPECFQKAADRHQVDIAILKSTQRVISLRPVLDSIRIRRDKWLAHLDEQSVRDPKSLEAKARLTIEDLKRTFQETEEILRELSHLFDGTIGPIRYVGDDDYKAVLDHVRHSTSSEMKEFKAKFEAQFGHPPRP